MKHETIEKNVGLMGVLIALVISVAGMAEIVPLMFQAQTTEPAPGVVPYPALELAGRDVYVSEGCYNCHSQMIRPFVDEKLRYDQRLQQARRFTTGHINGVQNERAPIWLELAGVILTNGI